MPCMPTRPQYILCCSIHPLRTAPWHGMLSMSFVLKAKVTTCSTQWKEWVPCNFGSNLCWDCKWFIKFFVLLWKANLVVLPFSWQTLQTTTDLSFGSFSMCCQTQLMLSTKRQCTREEVNRTRYGKPDAAKQFRVRCVTTYTGICAFSLSFLW